MICNDFPTNIIVEFPVCYATNYRMVNRPFPRNPHAIMGWLFNSPVSSYFFHEAFIKQWWFMMMFRLHTQTMDIQWKSVFYKVEHHHFYETNWAMASIASCYTVYLTEKTPLYTLCIYIYNYIYTYTIYIYILYTIYYILYTIYYILYTIYTIYTIYYILYILYILYTIYYILYTIYYILYTIYYILYIHIYYIYIYYTIPP